jgi:NTP pyrophosphatase (non-canonical NTP hydrolase)
MDINDLQALMRETYGARDRARGLDGTFRWLTEEVGELARAIRTGDAAERRLELSDVVAWVVSVANLLEVDLDDAMARYADGCPKCRARPCVCPT